MSDKVVPDRVRDNDEGVIGYTIRRLYQLAIVMLGITFITFGMLKTVPGDPARFLAGKLATPQRIEFVRHQRGLDLGTLIGGAFIVEMIFNRPGIGYMLLDATSGRDPAVIAGGTIFVSFFFVLCNLLVDLAYAWVDPRVRLGD